MIATIRALTGQHPRRYFGDTSDPAARAVRDLKDEARRVFRSRVVNPKWIDAHHAARLQGRARAGRHRRLPVRLRRDGAR